MYEIKHIKNMRILMFATLQSRESHSQQLICAHVFVCMHMHPPVCLVCQAGQRLRKGSTYRH